MLYIIINIIKNTDVPSSMLYFSDHGEEVFDDLRQKKMGRNEFDPTLAMYTVPFIIYGNEKWNKTFDLKELKKFTNRIYSSANLLHTYCDLAGITFDEFESQKSIINKDYNISQPILIGDPLKKSSLRDLLVHPL
jgi:heptose-I-phosphate ethanolaminephosphotransferase